MPISKLKKVVLSIGLSILLIIILAIGLFYKLFEQSLTEYPEAKNGLIASYWINESLKDSIYHYCKDRLAPHCEISMGMIFKDTTYFYGVLRKDSFLACKENRTALFQIGSISKVLTSYIYTDNLLGEKLSPEDRVSDVLGFPLNGGLDIRLSSLSNHTSGLPRLPRGFFSNFISQFKSQPYDYWTEEWFLKYLKEEIEVDHTKKDKVNYSNLGVSILGYCLAKKFKKSYAEILQSEILDPMEMHSSFVYTPSDYKKLTKTMFKGKEEDLWDLKYAAPAGGIVSNVSDMIKFIRKNLEGSNLTAIQMKQSTARIDSIRSVGIGWFILRDSSRHYIWHNGSTVNHNSMIILDENSQKGIVLLSNSPLNIADPYLDKLAFCLIKNSF